MARATSAPGGAARRGVASVLEVLKDNLEAFAIAIVMALVIKHFCLEAFKIPTSSMMPTLQGDDNSPNGGDRILVDKWAYLLSGPERWHVAVFRYPLDGSRNFIKRVAGLPGERLRIVGGDVWVKRSVEGPWEIATKPRRPRDELCTTVWPPEPGPRSAEETARRIEGAFEAETPGTWRLEAADRFTFVGGSSAALRYRPTIRSLSRRDAPEAGGRVVHDARFRAVLAAAGPATVSLAWSAPGGIVCEVRLSSAGLGDPSAAAVAGAGASTERRLAATLEPGRPLEVEMECIDGELVVSLDGREAARIAQGRRITDTPEYGTGEQRFAIRAAGAPVEVRDLRIDRDLWYSDLGMEVLDPERDGLEIPEGAYFMLGDNTDQSSDSRRWQMECLTLVGGRRICWDASGSGSSTSPTTWRPGEEGEPPAALARRAGTIRHVVDVDGVERWWREEDEDPERSWATTRVPFVPRDRILGRAFLVFWPVLPDFPGRLGFIH